MTNEEALKVIDIAIAEVEWEYPMEYAAAFELAKNALIARGEPVIIHKPTVGEFRRMAMQLGYEKVVRCKDCQYGRRSTLHDGIILCDFWVAEMEKDDYCSCGKRKEDTEYDK